MDFDAIVIGSGHNGLVCASYLARAGQKVAVVERRSFVGGATSTEELFPGYRLSSCAYICHLLQQKVIDDLELRRHGFDIFPLEPITRFQPYPDGRSLLLWDSVERSLDSIGQFSRADAEAFPRWQEFWQRSAEILYPFFLREPPTLSELRQSVQGTAKDHLEKLLTVSMTDLVREHFQDEAMQGAFIQAQDAGDPSSAGSAFCYTHIKCDMFSRPENVGIVKGGMGTVAKSIAAAATELGVTILTDAPVSSILVEAGRATGIELRDGSTMTASTVISNADPKTTFLKLVPDGAIPNDFRSRVTALKTDVAYLKFHAALNRLPDFSRFFNGDFDPRCLASVKICNSIEYFQRAWQEAAAGQPATAPVMEVQVPSVYDDSMAPPGHHVMSVWGLYAPVRPAAGTWDDSRVEVGEKLIDQLSIYAPDLRDCLVDWSLFTPADIEARVGMTDGNIRHLDMIPAQFLAQRPLADYSTYATPLDSLYLCGAGTHPGGEVTGAPGHNAAQAILNTL